MKRQDLSRRRAALVAMAALLLGAGEAGAQRGAETGGATLAAPMAASSMEPMAMRQPMPQPAAPAEAGGATTTADASYPSCSRTVADKCVQRTAPKARHAAKR